MNLQCSETFKLQEGVPPEPWARPQHVNHNQNGLDAASGLLTVTLQAVVVRTAIHCPGLFIPHSQCSNPHSELSTDCSANSALHSAELVTQCSAILLLLGESLEASLEASLKASCRYACSRPFSLRSSCTSQRCAASVGSRGCKRGETPACSIPYT